MLRFWTAARARRAAIDAEAREYLARHGPHAYEGARARIHEAERLGDRRERDHWRQVRAAIRKLTRRETRFGGYGEA